MVVQLITEDFIEGNYYDNEDCPLARALKRMGYNNVLVGGFNLELYGVGNTHSIDWEWDGIICNELIEKVHRGEQVTYEIELTEL